MASSVATEGFAADAMLKPLSQDAKSISSPTDPSQESEKGLETVPSTSGASSQEEEYVSGIRLALVLGSLTATYFLMMLDATILATAIPYITDKFHSLVDVGWYASAFQLTSSSLQPLTGKVYTRLNSKWSFLACLFVFELGSLLCAVATSSKMLIVGRAVAGIGGSGLMNGALTILNSCVPSQKQPALLGILMAVGTLGLAFGPLLGGAITEYASWRWCFYINLPVGAFVALVVTLISIPDKIPKSHWTTVLRNAPFEFDLVGFALFAPASIQFFLALQYGGNQYAWDSATVIGLFCGAGATFIVFLAWNYRRGEHAMIPTSVLRERAVWASCSAALFFGGSIFVTAYYLPIYFQDVLGKTPLMSGVDVLANILPQMVMTMVTGRLVQIFGYYLPFMLLCGVLNATACGLLSLLGPTTPVSQWVGFQVLLGLARGLGVSIPILAIQHALPKAQIPTGVTLFTFSQVFGGAVMISLSQTIFINSLRNTIPHYAPSVNAGMVIAAGGTRFREILPKEAVAGLLVAYGKSLGRIYYLTAGVAVLSLLFSWFMGWTDLRKKDNMGVKSKV